MFASGSGKCSEKEISDVVKCLHGGWIAPGNNAAALEKELAEFCNKKYGLMVNSRKSSILLSLIAGGISKDMKVLISTTAPDYYTAIIEQIGAKAITKYEEDIKGVIICESDIEVPENKDILIIEDFGYNSKKAKHSGTAIVTFENLCSVILFNSDSQYRSALNMRDWGRVGSQDEEFTGRYSNWILGDVRYDWKFVFNELGFNFKSCEMSATIALDRFRASLTN